MCVAHPVAIAATFYTAFDTVTFQDVHPGIENRVFLTEALPVGLDLGMKAAYFSLKLELGFFHQFTVLGDNFSFRFCSLHLRKKKAQK